MNKYLKSSKVLKTLIREISEVAGYLWQRGWAERNAGNISVHITEMKEQKIEDLSLYQFFNLPMPYPKLAGTYFLVTGTGKRMRDLARKPMKNALIIKLNGDASGYWIITSKEFADSPLPTSELPTHLGIHHMIAERGSEEKVVLHTHATELIALTHDKKICNQNALNRLLWSMHPETIVFVPKGVGFVPYTLPGSVNIAAKTIKALQNHNVAIWEKHGVFAIGNNVSDTFDVIDILAKSAKIYFMCRSANIIPDGLTDDQLDELKKLAANF